MLERPFQNAMNDEVRISPNGRSEMCVFVEAERKMAERLGGVAGLLQGTQHEVGDDAFFRLADNLSNQSLIVLRGDTQLAARERHLHATLAGGELRITPQHYQRLIRKVVGKPEERIVSYLMLRSLKQARYAAEPLGHFALGFGEYTHFTSPIRRYPDLIIHRILKWAIEHPNDAPASSKAHAAAAPGSESMLYSHRNLEEVASETSEAERRANGAERELMDWKTAQFMEEHLGEEYDALIISVQKYGCFVELFEVFVEGLLP